MPENEDNRQMPFQPGQMECAMFKMVLENNGFLRILLANQLEIMRRLGVDFQLPKMAESGINPGYAPPEGMPGIFDALAGYAHVLGEMSHTKCWMWAQTGTYVPGEDDC